MTENKFIFKVNEPPNTMASLSVINLVTALTETVTKGELYWDWFSTLPFWSHKNIIIYQWSLETASKFSWHFGNCILIFNSFVVSRRTNTAGILKLCLYSDTFKKIKNFGKPWKVTNRLLKNVHISVKIMSSIVKTTEI